MQLKTVLFTSCALLAAPSAWCAAPKDAARRSEGRQRSELSSAPVARQQQVESPDEASSPRWALVGEFTGLADGRYGGQLHYAFTPQTGLALTSWRLSSTISGTPSGIEWGDELDYTTDTTAYGIEVQYRLFVRGNDRAGWFMAPGVVAQYFTIRTTSHDSIEGVTTVGGPRSFAMTGGSFEFGAQLRAERAVFVASTGLLARGAVYRSADEDHKAFGWWLRHGPGFTPRFRVSFGLAF